MKSIFFGAVIAAIATAGNTQSSTSLPDGAGKALVIEHCAGACHEMQRIEAAQGSNAEWIVRIRRMIRRGAVIPPERIEPIAKYLAEALPPRVRAQATTDSPITTALGEVALRPIQSWVRGAGVMQADELTIIATLSLSDAASVKPGQRVRAFAVGSRSQMHQARVDRVTAGKGGVQVAVRLGAPARRDNYLLEIITEQAAVLSIPNEAIIEEGDRQVVYIQNKSGDFEPRKIQTGVQGELYTQVTGLTVGDQVVTFGSFFIDAEFKMKSLSDVKMPLASEESGTSTLVIDYRGTPDPPHEGDSKVSVAVSQANGNPLTDADVKVTYYMPAMASMNMPEMRDVFSLEHQGAGIYAGPTRFSMNGTWIVTVSVSKGGELLGSKELTVIAR